jgi:heme exporter protein D
MSLREFFHMGGYAFYVWTSYALAFIVLLANLLNPLFQERRLKRDLARRLRRAQRVPGRPQ